LDPDADPGAILNYLIKTPAVKRVGNHFLPSSRIVKHRRAPAQQQIHHRRVMLAFARMLESNARQVELSAEGAPDESREDSRMNQFVSTGFVPESQMQEFRKEMRQLNDETLVLVDGVMARRSQKRKRGERLVPVSEAIFMSENTPLAPPIAASRIARSQRRKK
jgi:hypothetical protein